MIYLKQLPDPSLSAGQGFDVVGVEGNTILAKAPGVSISRKEDQTVDLL